jgi:hypothetical protein
MHHAGILLCVCITCDNVNNNNNIKNEYVKSRVEFEVKKEC